MDYKKLGQRIRENRKLMRLSQEELAEQIEVSTVFVGQLERAERKPSVETLVNLSNTLKVPLESLLQDLLEFNDNIVMSEILNMLKGRDDKELILIKNVIKSIVEYLPEEKK